MSKQILNLIFFLILFCFIFAEEQNGKNNDDKKEKPKKTTIEIGEFIPKKQLTDVLKEMGLSDKQIITKKELREVFSHIINTHDFEGKSRKYDLKHEVAMSPLLNELVKEVPDHINITEIDKYLNKDVFMKSLSKLLGGIDLEKLADEALEQNSELKYEKKRKKKAKKIKNIENNDDDDEDKNDDLDQDIDTDEFRNDL